MLCQASDHMESTIKELAHKRRSIRYFTNDDVDEELLRECVRIAQQAPSNSNVQPWRLHLARGAARERAVSALQAVAREKGPNVPPLPEKFKHFRSELGHKLYGPDGYDIGRDEPERQKEAQLRNYDYFGAPVCGVITMHSDLGLIDALGVGMFTQTLWLALVERGLGACLQVSVTGYPEVLRRELRVPDDETIITGIAIGYPAPDSKVNDLVMERQSLDSQMILYND